MDHISARAAFEALMNDEHLDEETYRSAAHFMLAVMQYRGQGGDVDHASARTAFEALMNDVHLPQKYRSADRSTLEKIQNEGHEMDEGHEG